MRVVTKKTLIATVAQRFRETYLRRDEWLPTDQGGDSGAIYAKLSALPVTADEEEITAIAGDNRWTENICDECGQDSAVTVLLGEEIHHPTDLTAICLDCLKQARKLGKASK
jgi:hypothetical protein